MKYLYLIIVLSIILLNGCVLEDNNTFSDDKEKISLECEEYVEKIIPEEVELITFKSGNSKSYRFYSDELIWKDGLKSNFLVNIVSGSNPGENINYFYTKYSGRVKYIKQIINSDGLISEPIELTINNIGVEIISDERDYGSSSYVMVDAKIISYNIAECNI